MRFVTLLYGLAFTVLLSAASNAATVTTILTLDAATDAVNTFDLSLADGTSETTISGGMVASLEIDRVSGVITSLEFIGGDIVTSSWVMNVPEFGGINVTATEGTATADTDPEPPTQGNVTNGEFAANEHFIRLLSGTVQPGDQTLAGVDIEGTGTGTITSTRVDDEFEIVFSMNVDDSEDFQGPMGVVPLGIAGTVTARGFVTAIPEPSSAFALVACLGAFVSCRRKR